MIIIYLYFLCIIFKFKNNKLLLCFTIRNKKTRREYYLLEKFDVLNIAEKHFLISKQKDKNNEEIK